MLGRALDEHTPAATSKAASLLQQYQLQGSSNALSPSQSSALNAHRAFQTTVANPLKRTASQINGWQGWTGDASSTSRENLAGQGMLPARVQSLHQNVFFDENDFDDDSKIDLDEGEILPVPKKPRTDSVSTEQIQSPRANTTTKNAASSAPLTWSSSPPNQNTAPSPVKDAQPQPPIGMSKPTKRRTLFWLDGASKEGSQNGESLMPPQNDQSKSPYPWNKTASVIKDEQKRLRQGHKKLVKNKEEYSTDETKAGKKKKKSMAHVFLSDEQRAVLALVAEKKKSVFFTGSAGTGKSVLLREIIKVMRDKHKHELDRVAVTASTGLAACNIGGITLHSFAGIGLGKDSAPVLVRKIKKNAKARMRWLRVKVLIIDEVSMVDGELFDKLEEIARMIRNNGRPFGGIQLVITGDFFQLPPVPDHGRVSKFSFDAATWTTSIEHTIGLTQVFRQKDPVFANMLNEMRLGKLTTKSINAFRALNRPLNFEDDFEATELFPTRIEVDNANSARMRNLGGRDVEFKAVDGGSIQDIAQRDKLLSNCMAPQSITLKKGAQVMLIKNIDETLVNGSIGKVIAFMDEKTFEIYHEDEDGFQAVGFMDQDDERATSSRKKLKNLIDKDSPGDIRRKWPLVRFNIADGSSRDLLCQPELWNIELPSGEVQASRSQVPLILAWALSIHKAQGQTLDRVKVDLGKIFEKGQAYVALSRATCQEGLQISRFDPRKVMAHDRVRTFYNQLYSIDHAQPANLP